MERKDASNKVAQKPPNEMLYHGIGIFSMMKGKYTSRHQFIQEEVKKLMFL
jgi:hypothetical protein